MRSGRGKIMTLASLEPGQNARIVGVPTGTGSSQRLRDLGLISGEFVRVLKKAPLGDPIELRIMNYDLCIRKAEAEGILVEPV